MTGWWSSQAKPATASSSSLVSISTVPNDPTTSAVAEDNLPTTTIETQETEHAATIDLTEEYILKTPASTPVQNKIRAEITGINEELASYVCIEEKAGLSEEYKKRVEELKG